MVNTSDLFFEHMPEAAFFLAENQVRQVNPAARRLLPELEHGQPLPDYLDVVRPEGEFVRKGLPYAYHRVDSPEGSLVLCWPLPQRALTDRQLEGVVRELRELLGRMMLSGRDAGGAFRRDFCQMLRLVDHMDFLCRAGRENGVEFHPVTMDLAGLCRRTVQEAAPLLHEAGVEVELDPGCASLLMPGDAALLKQLLYGLLSNGAKEVQRGGGTLSVRLRAWRGWGLLTVSNGDSLDAEERLLALDPERDADRPPLPGEGAGMGLSVVREIARLHGGALLLERQGSRFTACVRLPTGPLDARLSVRSPRMETGGGFPMVAVELSDVLPVCVYETEDLLD